MENEEIRRKLMEAARGGVLVVRGPGYKIVEVVDYRLRTATWRDILCELGGKEVVFELTDEDTVKVWVETKEFAEPVIFGDDIIHFRHEILDLEESGRPLVTVNGAPEGRVSYAVYVGESGTAVCLEQWPEEGLKAYHLDHEIALSDINIIYL